MTGWDVPLIVICQFDDDEDDVKGVEDVEDVEDEEWGEYTGEGRIASLAKGLLNIFLFMAFSIIFRSNEESIASLLLADLPFFFRQFVSDFAICSLSQWKLYTKINGKKMGYRRRMGNTDDI